METFTHYFDQRDFDQYNQNQEVNPHFLFNFCISSSYESYRFQNLNHNSFTHTLIGEIESSLYFKKYYGDDKRQFIKFKKRFLSSFSSPIQKRQIYLSHFIEDMFSRYCSILSNDKLKFQELNFILLNLIYDELKTEPISKRNFPRFISSVSQTDEEIMEKILEKNDGNSNETQENKQETIFSFNDLIQFYDILSKYTKPFSFSQKFVNLAIKKFDYFLNTLQKNSNNDDHFQFNYFSKLDSKSEEFKCFKLTLMIKMRLFMMNRQMHDFLIVLLQLLIIDQENPPMNEDDHFSFKKFINEILPNTTTRRTTIIRNIINDQILDFSFSNDKQNDYILTKEGVFKLPQNFNEQIEFDTSKMTEVLFNTNEENEKIHENLKKSNKETSKIAFSNGILYLFTAADNTIHKVIVSQDEELTQKLAEKQKKFDKAKEHFDQNQRKKSKKKKFNKFEEEDEDKNEVDLESIQIEIPQYPIISFASYDNYVRIVQRKNCDDKNKLILLFINVDLTPNNRTNYNYNNIEEAFEIDTKTTDKKCIQTQFEIEIKNDENIKLNDVLFSEDSMYLLFNDNKSSSYYYFQKWLVLNNGNLMFAKKMISPFVVNSNSVTKMDNKSFIYNFIPLKNEDEFGASITQFYLPETQHFLREEENLFLKYPYLQKLSNIIDNCSQFIINNTISNSFTIKNFKDELNRSNNNDSKKVNPLKLTITGDEICSIINPISLVSRNLEDIKMLIKCIKNESLQKFFICLFIKLTGIFFAYESIKRITTRSNIETFEMDGYKAFKSFVLDLYSMFPSSSSSDLMIRESMIFTLSIAGKLLFFHDSSYNDLRSLMNRLFYNDHFIFKSLLNFMFSNVSSLYFIDQSFYDKLIEIKDEIDITQLFTKNILFILFEIGFPFNLGNEEFIENASPYINALFQYVRYIIENESISFEAVEQIMAYIFSLPTMNTYLSLILEKELININSILYNRIKKIPGVVENDQEFLKKNQDIKKQEFPHETIIIESEHPYNQEPVPIPYKEQNNKKNKKNDNKNKNKKDNGFHELNKKFYIKSLGTVDFGNKADNIYILIDHKSELQEKDIIIIYENDTIHMLRLNNETLNEFHLYSSTNKIKVAIGRYIKNSQKVNNKFWGVKLNIIGIKSDTSFFWNQNHHLVFYNFFIASLMCHHSSANLSTPVKKDEEDFQIILDDNIIQGIKLEDIDNYENQNQNQNDKFERAISRGISRGISYDSEEELQFDTKLKKDFLNKIISLNQENKTPEKRFIDAIYTKTAKRNIIKLNKSTQSILESEHLFAACLFKQLGLITTCINFLRVLNVTKNDEIQNLEFPKTLLSIWKKIYSLRNSLYYEYSKLKSKSQTNDQPSSYETLIKSVNQKCKMLLYSDPILQFKEKDKIDNESFEKTAKSILSFVTSKIPLSDISKLIDIRKKRLSILKQSDSLLLSFVEQNSLFESSKPVFAFYYDKFKSSAINNCAGVKQSEIESYKKLLGKLVLEMTKNIFTQPSIAMIIQPKFIVQNIMHLEKSDSLIQTSEIIKEMIERNKSNNSFFNVMIGIILVYILILICLQTEDNKLIDYIVSLLLEDNVDKEIKVIILISIPALIQFTQIDKNHRILDESFIFDIYDKNKNNSRIVCGTFYWIAFVFDAKKEKSQNRQDFILKVFEAIGHIFLKKRCSFVDDSHEPNLQASLSLLMDFFIKLIYNQNDENLLSVVHDILTNKINNIENEKELIITIGLFISFGEHLIPTSPHSINTNDGIEPIGFTKSTVLLENKNLELNEKEIDNLLKLHEYLIHSDFMNDKRECNENPIDSKEITESILIASFYCFLPIIMQIKNNACILLNEKNIQRTLFIFEFAMKSIPSDLNSIDKLTSKLLLKINDATSINNNIIKFDNSFKFMKSNYGKVIYSDGKSNDLIKTNKNYTNVFLCNKPFYFDCKTYFEIKVCANNCKNIFIGFVNAEENDFEKAFGFGCLGYKSSFCRKSELISNDIFFTADEIMINDQIDKILIKEGDIIGCYYTPEYTYLTINGQLTQYRITNKSLKLYIPIIIVDHDQLDIEITRNVSIVDNSDNQFNFLKIDENTDDSFFNEKDIKSLMKSDDYVYFRKKTPLIGNIVKVSSIILSSLELESVDVFPKELVSSITNNGTIKDIIIDENSFVSKYKMDIINLSLIKTITGDYDSRLFSLTRNSLYNVVGNITETHLEIDDIDMECLPKQLRNSSNLKSIQQYIIKQSIRNCSKSIAIIMTRYLVFILIDYLRYSKSKLLLENDTKEMQIIIKSLAFSLPTITQFSSTFDFKITEEMMNKYLIFHDEQNDDEINDNNDDECMKFIQFKSPGNTYMFHYSFKVFLKKSESFISIQFIIKLLKEIYENNKNNSLSLDEIYCLIKKEYKLESISPLPDSFNIQMDNKNNGQYFRFIPIIVSSIPENLPSVVFANKRLRNSSDQISYCYSSYAISDFYWKYDIKNLKDKNFDRNYKLKCGLLNLDFELNEKLLNSPLGYIQMVFIILQSFLDSDYLYENKIEILCNGIFEDILSLKKDILVFPFLESLIISILSITGFSNYLNNSDKIFEAFKYLSYNSYNKICQMDSFPTSKNELPLIFSLYSTLIQTFNDENTIKDKSLLFDKYKLINNELFNVLNEKIDKEFVEGSIVKDDQNNQKKKKNHSLLYILYYYSVLLYNKDNLPYPKFLFVNDLIRQHFGGFRTVITKDDIKEFEKKKQNEIIYKSEVFNNDKDLFCSCKFINSTIKQKRQRNRSRIRIRIRPSMILSQHFRASISDFIGENENENDKNDVDENKIKNDEIRNENSCKIFIHQLNDDTKIEIIPTSEELVLVSFPLQVLICSTDSQKELVNIDAFVIDFSPSEEQQKQYFVDNYDKIQEDFNKFIELGQYDNEISKFALAAKADQDNNNNNENSNQDNNNNNNNNDNDDADDTNPFENDFQDNFDDYDDDDDDFNGFMRQSRGNRRKGSKYNACKFYQLDQIQRETTFQSETPEIQNNPSIILLRCHFLHQYGNMIESINSVYSNSPSESPWDFDDSFKSFWILSLSSKDKLQNLYTKQIIRPAYSMNTEAKFKFINQVFMGSHTEQPEFTVEFNRFEQQKFIEKFDENNKNNNNNNKEIKARPLIIQLMEQVDVDSLSKLKVRGGTPFKVTLVGENPIDLGGPGRELFASLTMELVNDHIGIFTFNPNRRHEVELTNQESMIPNKNSTIKSFYFDDDGNNDYYYMFKTRFIYAGALIAICIVSDLPQQMKLASFIWEFLSIGSVSIDSIYEIDNNFKQIIESAEKIMNISNSSSLTDDEFESLFLKAFEIHDSFDNVVELIPSGSKKRVTKENLKDFIELAKNYRIHEFDKELKDLKKGFDIIMCYKNVTSILNPKELELLCCGESNCSVDQMKKLFVFEFTDRKLSPKSRDNLIKMFWNVVESFSPDERILLIKFSSGNMGLPSPGVRWKQDIKVMFLSKESREKLAKSHTCFSTVELPYFESEEQLSKVLKTSINFSGLITDSHENVDAVADFL